MTKSDIFNKPVKPKFILINPWVYDFSAMNLWSRPLGLLKVAEYLSRFDINLELIDCTGEVKIKRKFGTGKFPRQIIDKPEALKNVPKNFARYGMDIDVFSERFKRLLPCDMIFVTSIMTYWYPGVFKVIEIVKSLSPDTPVILGGIYATLFHEHAQKYSGADYVFRRHVHNTACLPDEVGGGDGLESIIQSLGCRLTGKRKPKSYNELGFYGSYPFVPLLTSEGCPYRCSYCASSVLFDGFIQRQPLAVVSEIKELYDIGVRDFAFYDDALLENSESHLKLILKEIINSKIAVRFHCPNGLHAKYIDDEMAYLMKKSGFTTLRLSLETVNTERQMKTGGKVTTDVFLSAVRNLKNNGFQKEDIGVYLMYGLPGQQLEEVEEGKQFLKSLDVRINLTEFSPMPYTACWEELKSRGIIDDNIDPILTNNTVFSILYSEYDMQGLEKLRLDVKQYNSQNIFHGV